MNITRVLNVALPDMPARILSDRPPRIPPDAVFKEHIEDGQPIVRVLVPSQDAMYRFPRANWTLVQLFDGQRTYEEIAKLYSSQIGTAYDVEEVREFTASLESMGFWYKTPQEKNVILMQQTAEERRNLVKSRKSKFGDLSQIVFPAVNPDRFLTWLYRHTSFVYTWWFTTLTLIVFALMTGITIAYWSEIGSDTAHFFNFSEKTWADVGVFYVVAIISLCWHEMAHGHACKHYGGRVPSMGFLLIYLTPAFYTDIGEGQVLASRYQRLIISLAGAWAELYICAVATFIWWGTSPDTTVHEIAYMLMLISGIASVLINFNPLMKLDGYHIMCEVLGISDLKEVSTAYVSSWVKRYIWKLPVEVPYVPRRRRLGFAVYAILSGLYSYTVLFVLARFVGNVFRNFNPDWSFIPELGTAAVIFRSRIRTLVNFMKLVYLDKKDRIFAWFTPRHSIAVTAGLAIVLVLPLWRESVSGRFLLEPAHLAAVRAPVAGAVTQLNATEGESIEAGTLLAKLQNLPLQSNLEATQARMVMASDRAKAASLHYTGYGAATKEKERLSRQLQQVSEMRSELQLTSPIAGTVITARVQDRLGSYLKEGDELLEVADLSEMKARIYVSEHDLAKVSADRPARLQVDGFFRKWDSRVQGVEPAATELNATFAASTKFAGLNPPNFYVVDLLIANSDLRLKPGMIGWARVYGKRRSIGGMALEGIARFFERKVW
jgi:putative peptide zinc metalloprotease protein